MKKLISKIKSYFTKSQEKPPEARHLDGNFYLNFNVNNFKFLEWVVLGNMMLPMFYFIKDGNKQHYLHWFDKTVQVNGVNQRMFLVDKDITTLN